MSTRLAAWNSQPAEAAIEELLVCCASRRWAGRLVARRPFEARAELLEAAAEEWRALEPADWLEAFAAHPRIGEREGSSENDAEDASASLSRHEQRGTEGAAPEILERLAAGNRVYEERFGFVFLIRAAGRSAAEMLSVLEERSGNDRDTEIEIAAREQSEITRLRLEQRFR